MPKFIQVTRTLNRATVTLTLNIDTISYFLRHDGDDYTRINLTIPSKEGHSSITVKETPEELIKLMHPVV